jgi:hypothetical protein
LTQRFYLEAVAPAAAKDNCRRHACHYSCASVS